MKFTRAPVMVSDHALIRYIERVLGYDVEGLRAKITARASPAAAVGAVHLVADGFRYVFVEGVMVTVYADNGIDARTAYKLEQLRRR